MTEQKEWEMTGQGDKGQNSGRTEREERRRRHESRGLRLKGGREQD